MTMNAPKDINKQMEKLCVGSDVMLDCLNRLLSITLNSITPRKSPVGIKTEAKQSQVEMKYKLRDFPKPFVSEEGLDVLFVYGTSSLDYSDYKEYMRQRGENIELRTAFQRIGDFDPLLTLASRFGIEVARIYRSSSPDSSIKICCYGRQDFTLTDDEKERHNLLLVGSGYVNKITKEVLEYYYKKLPIRFDMPDSHQAIIRLCDSGDVEVYDRTITGKNVGLIIMLPSPFNLDKAVLIAAGLRTTGTQAAILALCDAFDRKVFHHDAFEVLVRAKRVENKLGKPIVKDYEIIAYASHWGGES